MSQPPDSASWPRGTAAAAHGRAECWSHPQNRGVCCEVAFLTTRRVRGQPVAEPREALKHALSALGHRHRACRGHLEQGAAGKGSSCSAVDIQSIERNHLRKGPRSRVLRGKASALHPRAEQWGEEDLR